MRFIALIIVSLACFTRAEAEIVHFRMTGNMTVDFALGELPDGSYEGAPFQVDLSYDTATPDSYADDPQRGLYTTVTGPDNFLRFRAGPAEVIANDLRLWVGNDIDGNPQPGDGRPIWEHADDAFQMLTSTITANFPIPPYHSIFFEWRGSTRAVLNNDALPTQLDIDAFRDTWFKVTTISLNPGSQFAIRGIVDDINLVPEPKLFPAASIFGLMLGTFVQYRQFLSRVRIYSSLCSAVVVGGLLASNANAEIVRLKLTGEVAINGSPFNILPDDLVAGASTDLLNRPDFDAPGGKRFVAFWSYDTSIPDVEPELPYSGVYQHPLSVPVMTEYGLSVRIDDYVFRLDTSVDAYTVNVGVGRLSPQDVIGRGDGISVSTANVIAPFVYDSPTLIHDSITLAIGDSVFSTAEASTLLSDALPGRIDVGEFDFARIQIVGVGTVSIGSTPPPTFFIQAWIDEIATVPEPPFVTFIVGALLLMRFRRV